MLSPDRRGVTYYWLLSYLVSDLSSGNFVLLYQIHQGFTKIRLCLIYRSPILLLLLKGFTKSGVLRKFPQPRRRRALRVGRIENQLPTPLHYFDNLPSLPARPPRPPIHQVMRNEYRSACALI